MARGSLMTTSANFSRVVTWIIGPVYFHSILHSLVSRDNLKNILRGAQPTAGGEGRVIPLVSMGQVAPGFKPNALELTLGDESV